MTGVDIVGVGMTPFESETEASLVELAVAAAEDALTDAGLETDDVTSMHVGNMLAESTGVQSGLGNALVSALGVEGATTDRVENTSASGASAAHRGVEAVASGTSEFALVVGAEKMSVGDTASVTESISQLIHQREYDQGITLPSFGGLAASAYLDRYDVPREALAEVAVKNHANAASNPVAQFQKSIDADDVLSSPVVADPLRLYDCCPMTDGAAAIVLSRSREDIHIASIGSATGTHAVADRPDPLEIESVQTAGKQAFNRAGMTPEDIDIACIHDAFTILEWLELEELGFYDPGSAWKATIEGETSRDGSLPVNPGGGLKARGHPLGATGISQLVELTWQLRGELTDNRQVRDVDRGFAINVAGFGNNSVCTILES